MPTGYGTLHEDHHGSTETFEITNQRNRSRFECQKSHVLVIFITLSVLALILGLGFGLSHRNKDEVIAEENLGITQVVTISDEVLQTSPKSIERTSEKTISNGGTYSKAAVASDGKPCAKIGVDVLKRNGTAVDAAIAALICNGVYSSQSMGIGGGFLMTIYTNETGKVETLNARETAPGAATKNMYHGDEKTSEKGPLSIAIPGEIFGYFKAKEKYGNKNISMLSLMQPTIDMCRNGIEVSWSAVKALKGQEELIIKDPGMRKIFINPSTNRTWKEGDVYKRENLAATLEKIGKNGLQEFYSGDTAKVLIDELRNQNSILTLEDLQNYRAIWGSDVKTNLPKGKSVHSFPLPGSGVILTFILDILKWYGISPNDDLPLLYHRMVESFKWGYGYRSKLGDPFDEEYRENITQVFDYMTKPASSILAKAKINDSSTSNDPNFYGGDFVTPTDAGTSHTSVVAPNGDAVSVTSTINGNYGSVIMSPTTGIIMNNEMDDFSSPDVTNEFGLPPSASNFIKPGKRPLSSMSPTIVLDNDSKSVRLVTGAAGGSKITTAVAQIIIHNLWLNDTISEAIDAKRIHHQLLPMRVDYEKGLKEDIVEGFQMRGHEINQLDSAGSTVTGIEVLENGQIRAYADKRKAGGVDGF